MKKFFCFSWLTLIVTSIFVNPTFAQLKVIYPNVNGQGDQSFGYAALKLALENSGTDFELTVSSTPMNNARTREQIKEKKISISDFGTSAEFENDLLPIYFPIDLGLNGWRIFLIHKDKQMEFEKIKTIGDLRKKKAGQGIGWSDTAILETAGLSVYRANDIQNLVKMVENKRLDFFPLGANEVHSLLEEYKEGSPNVVVEPQILLIYPFGRLFFVHRENKELHHAVQMGLMKAYENGSFWKLFKSHPSNDALFTKANLKSRTQILIDNTNMTKNFKKIPEKYFFKIEMLSD